MANDIVLMMSIAVSLMIIALLFYVDRIFRVSVSDFWETEAIETPITLALGLVILAIILSMINIGIVSSPIPIDMNVTGVLIPLVVSVYIVLSRRVKARSALFSIITVSAITFPLAYVTMNGISIAIFLWLLPVSISALLGYLLGKTKEPMSVASLAYLSASMGMLIGGDLANIPNFISSGGSSLVLGAGGLMDFVFLAGPFSVAILWGVLGAWMTIKKRTRFRFIVPKRG